jgi:glycosyltransferase involved in cell wall biosynthesis
MLDETLQALALQVVPAGARWSVLVVNNNCTDDTSVVAQRHIAAQNVPGLRVVLETVPGLTPARHRGVRSTTAPWIAFVDDDCILHPDWVAQAIKFASEHPTCGGFGGRVILDWEIAPPVYVRRFTHCFAEQELGSVPKPVKFIVGAGMTVNRSALVRVGWCDRHYLADRVGKRLVSGGDVEIALRIRSRYQLWYNPACQLRHRITKERISRRYLRRVNYGLGTSKFLNQLMLWDKPYWFAALRSIRQGLSQLRHSLITIVRAALARRLDVAVITFCFLLGYSAGMWRLVRMSRQQRFGLIGCARSRPR